MSVLTLLPKPHKPPSALVQLCVVIRRLEDILEMKENTRAMYLRDLAKLTDKDMKSFHYQAANDCLMDMEALTQAIALLRGTI